jgi:hypothetical protein
MAGTRLMTSQQITLRAPVPAGGTITVPAALLDGESLTAVVHVPAPVPVPVVPPANAVKVAAEGGSFTLLAATTVWYGAGAKFVAKQMPTGKVACTNTVFGDPNVGTVKACYSVPVAAALILTAIAGSGSVALAWR